MLAVKAWGGSLLAVAPLSVPAVSAMLPPGPPMRLSRAALFTARYRELVAAEGLTLDAAPDPVDVPCPRCGALYVADLDPGEEPFDLEALEWLALVRLEEECPDHPVRFAVGP